MNNRLDIVKLYRDFDKMVESVAETETACKAGCSYCCHIRVVAHADEIFHAVDHIVKHLDGSTVQGILKRAESNVALIKNMTVEEHIATNIACPLLDSTSGRCMAYAARPSRCRGYNSLDVEICKKAHVDTSYSEPHPYEMNITMNAAAYHELVKENLERIGSDSNLYEFNGGLVEAFRNPTSRERWLKGKKAFSQKLVSTI